MAWSWQLTPWMLSPFFYQQNPTFPRKMYISCLLSHVTDLLPSCRPGSHELTPVNISLGPVPGRDSEFWFCCVHFSMIESWAVYTRIRGSQSKGKQKEHQGFGFHPWAKNWAILKARTAVGFWFEFSFLLKTVWVELSGPWNSFLMNTDI